MPVARVGHHIVQSHHAFSAKRRPEQGRAPRQAEILERFPRRARKREQHVRLAVVGHRVVEERAKLGPRRFNAGVGHFLHERVEIEFRGELAPDRRNRRWRPHAVRRIARSPG
jgi:hypothetical protein